MNELADLFSLSPVFSIATVAIAGIGGFIIGYFVKSGVIAKHKKRVLGLENEMLSNHSRILELEKKIADLKNDQSRRQDKEGGTTNLKIS
jgi:hypothetical protein